MPAISKKSVQRYEFSLFHVLVKAKKTSLTSFIHKKYHLINKIVVLLFT